MADPIEFFFDFSSPYGYLAAQQIDAIGAKHGRDVVWKPFLIGVAFKTSGQQPLLDIPMKGDYALHDMKRSARLIGVPLQKPASFPFMSVAAARACYWVSDDDPAKAKALAKALYHAAFGAGGDISGAAAVIDIAETLGIDRAALSAALQDPAVKARLKSEVDAGLARGVFGSPYVFVDGEPFWGHDRLDQIDHWLETGGW